MLVAQCGVVGVDRVYGVDAPQLMHGARVHVDAQVDHGEPCIFAGAKDPDHGRAFGNGASIGEPLPASVTSGFERAQ